MLSKRICLAILSLLLTALHLGAVRAQSSAQSLEPPARKFDELTASGGPRYRCPGRVQEDEKEMRARLLRYAGELRREAARAYIIGYGPRVAEWDIYGRSDGERRAGLAKERLSAFFDYRRITSVDGGFRETAQIELWIVPQGARPPRATPTVGPEEVVRCPFTYINAAPYLPVTSQPLEFKAVVESNDKRIAPVFAWRVSRGQIVAGQGTDTIRVELPGGTSGAVVASLSVGGYSLECPVETTSITAQTIVGAPHFLFDTFGNINCEDEAARLDNLAATLQNDPALQAHVIWYGGRVGPRNEALARAARMRSYLVQARGIEAERVLTIDGGFRDKLSGELWLSARGAGAPTARATVDRKFVRLKGTVNVINSPCSF